MGLFGMFEKKKLSGYEKNLDTIYRFAIEKGLIKYYPDGKEQIDIVIKSIADIVGVDIQKLEPEKLFVLFNAYIIVMSKVKEANIPEFRVSVMLAGSFAGYRVMNDNAYDNIVAYSLINAEESSFSTSSINANERIEKKRIEIFGE